MGAQIGTVTQTFNIPFRPSANNKKCTGPDLGKWFHAGTCFKGKATKVTFNLTGVKLPSKAIVSVAFNTTNYGAAPVSPKPCNAFNPERCPYNSLNVGVREVGEGPPSLGTDPFPSSVHQLDDRRQLLLEPGRGGHLRHLRRLLDRRTADVRSQGR